MRDHAHAPKTQMRGQLLLVTVTVLDLIALSALLYFTGGAANPFALFYLVNLALSAVILPSPWVWILGAAAWLNFAVLHVSHEPLPELFQFDNWLSRRIGREISLQTQGQLVAPGYVRRRDHLLRHAGDGRTESSQ